MKGQTYKLDPPHDHQICDECERLSQRLTDVRGALQTLAGYVRNCTCDWSDHGRWDEAHTLANDVLRRMAAADWQAMQKQVQDLAKKAREASSG